MDLRLWIKAWLKKVQVDDGRWQKIAEMSHSYPNRKVPQFFITSNIQQVLSISFIIKKSLQACAQESKSIQHPQKILLIPSVQGGGRRSSIFDPFSLDLQDHFEGFLFSTSLSNIPSTIGETSAFTNTRINWKETPEAHVFRADLPGVKKEEVKVEVEEGRVFQISGERSKDQEEKNDKWHRIERSSGKFLRRLRLLENAKTDEVKASMENGVLTVTVPKEEVKKAEVQTINFSG